MNALSELINLSNDELLEFLMELPEEELIQLQKKLAVVRRLIFSEKLARGMDALQPTEG